MERSERAGEGYQVVILDHHPSADARIDKHIRLLLENDIPTYRINFNKYSSVDCDGEFSLHGERAYMIDLHRDGSELATNLRLDTYFLTNAADDALRALRAMGLDDRGDVVLHLHNHPMLPIARKLRRRLNGNVRIVYDRHEANESGHSVLGVPASIYGRRFEYPWRNAVDGVVAVTDDMARYCEGAFPNAHVVTVKNYPDLNEFNGERILSKISEFSDDTTIVMSYIGSLNNEFDRDVDLMLDIASSLIESGLDLKFYLGGRHAPQDLMQAIGHMGAKYPEIFHFMGEVARREVIETAEMSHISLLMLKPDSGYWVPVSANKVYEGIVCGSIIVARACLEEASRIEDCSMIFGKDDDPGQIIDRVIRLSKDRERMRSMMGRARELGKEFSWERVAPRYLELYDIVLGR